MIGFPFFDLWAEIKWKMIDIQYEPAWPSERSVDEHIQGPHQNLTKSYFFLNEERLKLVYILTNKTKLFRLTYCHLHSLVKLSDTSVRPDIERFSNGKQYQELRRCFKSEKCYVSKERNVKLIFLRREKNLRSSRSCINPALIYFLSFSGD